MKAAEILESVYNKYVRLYPEDNWDVFKKDDTSIKLCLEAMDKYLQQSQVEMPSNNDILHWAEEKYGSNGTPTIMSNRDVSIAIRSATAVRDGKIPITDNETNREEKETTTIMCMDCNKTVDKCDCVIYPVKEATSKIDVKIRIERDDDMAAFGAYASESKGLILLNIDAIAICSIEENIGYKELLIQTLSHEITHYLEEKIGLEFSEERVDKILNSYKEKYHISAIDSSLTQNVQPIEPRKQECVKIERPIKKTAEQIIIDKVGEFWWVCGKHRREFIEAMYEFDNQFPVKEEKPCMPSDEQINAYAELYPDYLGVDQWDKGMKHGIKHGAKALRDGKI